MILRGGQSLSTLRRRAFYVPETVQAGRFSLRRNYAIGMNADTDWANRTTNIGGLGHTNITLVGWHYRSSAGLAFSDIELASILGASHGSNGRYIGLKFDNTFDGTINGARLSISDQLGFQRFGTGDDHPPFDTWVFYILRSSSTTPSGPIVGEWSELGSSTWHSLTGTNNVEDSVQAEQVLLGRTLVGEAQTSYGHYAYIHAYSSDIGQSAARALKTATTPQNSPWAFWPLDDNTDTADDSGNGRTLTFNGTMTSETSPDLDGGGGGTPAATAKFYRRHRG